MFLSGNITVLTELHSYTNKSYCLKTVILPHCPVVDSKANI